MASYLVSSVSAHRGGVFRFDSDTGQIRLLLRGRFRGLTIGEDNWIYTVSGCRTHRREVETHLFRLHPESGDSVDLGPVPWRACHDLRWYRGHFYLVASIGNSIVRLDRNLREVDRMQIVADEEDICHVNCLAEHDGELYCSIFTLSSGTRAEKRGSPQWTSEGKILRLDWEQRRFSVCAEPLAQPHSLNWRGPWLYLLESHTSAVSRVDVETGRIERLAHISGFMRGLAFTPGEAVIGVCQMFRSERSQSRLVPFLARLRDRFQPFQGLLVVDPETWKIRRRVAWPLAEAYDILPLP